MSRPWLKPSPEKFTAYDECAEILEAAMLKALRLAGGTGSRSLGARDVRSVVAQFRKKGREVAL